MYNIYICMYKILCTHGVWPPWSCREVWQLQHENHYKMRGAWPPKGCRWKPIKRNMAGVDPPHYIGDMFMGIFYTQKTLHKQTCTQRSFYTQELLHTEAFTQRSLLGREVFTQRSFYTEKSLHRGDFTHRSFYTISLYTEELLHAEAFTRRGA